MEPEEQEVNPIHNDADALAARYVAAAGLSEAAWGDIANEYEELIREAYRAGEEFN